MKDKDFQQLVDREFAQLEWTDAQRMDTLRQMNKEDRPVMKRKFSVVLIAAMLLLTLTGTAVAAGLNITTMKEFFDRYTHYWQAYGYNTPVLDESKVVQAKGYRHTSNLLDVVVDQMYLTDEALYFTIQYTPKHPNTLLFDGYHKSITLDGEDKDYWELWDRKELMLLWVNGVRIEDLNGDEPVLDCYYQDSTRDPETGAITQWYMFRDPGQIDYIRSRTGGTMMLRFEVSNLRNYDVEWDVLFVDFPKLEIAPTLPDGSDN